MESNEEVINNSKKKDSNEDIVKRTRKRTPNENTVSERAKKYFESLGEKNINGKMKVFYECKMCCTKLNGDKLHNLAAHIYSSHPEFSQEINGEKKQSPEIVRIKLLNNLVEIVALNGRPFKSLSDSGLQEILQDKLNALKAAGIGICLSDPDFPEVKKHLHEMATRVRKKIKEEVSGRALFLMVDIVKKNQRAIFGVSIQYIIDANLKVRSIGMIELEQSNTAKYLADVICERLKMYEIDLKQIFTITTDNGKNVLKMVRDIDTILQERTTNGTADKTQNIPEPVGQNGQSSANEQDSDVIIDDEIELLLQETDDENDDEVLESLFDEAFFQRNETLLTEMSNQIINDFIEVIWDITGVNCSAHTLQLSIKDALKKILQKHQNVIKLCRKVAKVLRLKSTQHKYQTHFNSKYHIPRLDNDTRWGTMYTMVSTFVFVCVSLTITTFV